VYLSPPCTADQEQVGRLYVPMDDPFSVRCFEPFGNLNA
jgi:hypothetical protein